MCVEFERLTRTRIQCHRHVVLRNAAGTERYFSVREKSSMKSDDVIGLGKKQREWAGVQIGDKVKGNSW